MRSTEKGMASSLGIASLIGFVASQAVRDVYLGHLFGQLGLFEVAALAFGTAALVFGAALLVFSPGQLRLLIRGWRTVLLLNLTTAMAWLSYFQALRLVEPAAVNLAFSGIAPVAVMALGALGLTSQGERRPGNAERAMHWGLACCVLALALTNGAIGVSLAAMAGTAIAAETIYAKRFNHLGVSPLAIVGSRYLLVAVIAGSVAATLPQPFNGMSAIEMGGQAVIFLAILIGPIYLAQAGVALTSPLVAGAICALGPVATLVLQTASGEAELSATMLAITAIYAILAVIGSVLASRGAGRGGAASAARTASEAPGSMAIE